jgi:hypothetical protein
MMTVEHDNLMTTHKLMCSWTAKVDPVLQGSFRVCVRTNEVTANGRLFYPQRPQFIRYISAAPRTPVQLNHAIRLLYVVLKKHHDLRAALPW